MTLGPNVVKLAAFSLNLAVVIQWMSLLFIPTIYNTLSDELGYTEQQLGLLLTTRLVAMFCSLPFYAWLCYYRPRNEILSFSMFLSMITNLLNVFAVEYASFLIINILTGFFLGGVIPVGRSLIPIYFKLEDRGRWYGYFELSSGIGGFLGCGVAVAVVMKTMESQYPSMSWQMVYCVISVLKLPSIICSLFYVLDPVLSPELQQYTHKELVLIFPGLQDEASHIPSKEDMRKIMRNPMYLMILGQGLGAFPWSGNSFLILWFQRMDIPEGVAVVIFAAVGLGAALGGLIGGVFGDRLVKNNSCGIGEKYGRILVAHISVIMGIPFISVLMFTIPREAQYWWVYAIVGGLMGLCIAWPPANNSANQSDIFSQRLHPMSFAIQYWIEGTIASFCPFTIGYLTENVFDGADLTPPGGQTEWDSFSPEKKLHALNAMAKSIVLIGCLFWGVAQFFYFGMYYYYPKLSRSLNPNCFEE
jgi:MFS family permease